MTTHQPSTTSSPKPKTGTEAETMEVATPGFKTITPPAPKPQTSPVSDPPPSSSSPPLVDDVVSDAAESLITGSTRASTRRANPAVVEALAPLAGVIFVGIGVGLHAWRSPKTQAWLLAPEQAADLATPLCRIMARRMPEGLADESDIGDVLEFGVKATGYGIESFMEERTQPATPPAPVDHSPLAG